MAQTRHVPATSDARISRLGTTAPLQAQRLFVALFPDAAACESIAGLVASLDPPLPTAVKAIARESYHVTLHFLGDYDDDLDVLERRAMAACVSVRAAAFVVSFDRLGNFKAGKPVGVLRSTQTLPGLLELWAALRTPLARAGFGRSLEPEFVPHVTLYHGDHALPSEPIAPIAWRASEFRLIRSTVGQGRYHELGRWPLSEP